VVPRHAISSAIEQPEVKGLIINIYDHCLTNISVLGKNDIGIKSRANADAHTRRRQLPKHHPTLTEVFEEELQNVFTMNITLQECTIIQA